MPRRAEKLSSDIAIKRLKPKPGQKNPIRYTVAGDVAGLCIQVTPTGKKSWLFRATVGMQPHTVNAREMTQVRREFGLGGYPAISLQAARDKAKEFRNQLAQGMDPLAERKAAHSAKLAALAKLKTFAECEAATLAAKADSYKNPVKASAEWRTRMDNYVIPILGQRIVGDLTVNDVADVLEPIWRTKYHTAKKIKDDMAAVFRYAKAKDYRTGENPAASDALEPILGKPRYRGKHQPSLPYPRMAKFLVALHRIPGESARALEFAILTAARSDEVRSAPWAEFDLDKKIWTIPAKRMKRGRHHRIPLSDQAVDILRRQLQNGNAYPFVNRQGEVLTDMTMSGLIKRMHANDIKNSGKGYLDPAYDKIAVPHGFRSSFKDWARNLTQYADEVSELALAHVNSDSTRAAYARDELLGLRTPMMQEWADYCCSDGFLHAPPESNRRTKGHPR